MDDLIDVKQAAAMLGISRWTLEVLKSQRKVPYVRLGRRTLFDINDLKSFIEANKVAVRD
jgi:excisionase family DNA binding protein